MNYRGLKYCSIGLLIILLGFVFLISRELILSKIIIQSFMYIGYFIVILGFILFFVGLIVHWKAVVKNFNDKEIGYKVKQPWDEK